LRELKDLGCTIVHGVDVHTMLEHPLLEDLYFDRIIFNFPHAGLVSLILKVMTVKLSKL